MNIQNLKEWINKKTRKSHWSAIEVRDKTQYGSLQSDEYIHCKVTEFLNIYNLLANILKYFSYFSQKKGLICLANCLLRRQFTWNVEACFFSEKKNHLSSAEIAHRVVNVLLVPELFAYLLCVCGCSGKGILFSRQSVCLSVVSIFYLAK